MQCSTVVAWSKPGLDPCEIKKKGLPFQLKFIKHSQALSNMKGHRMQFLKGPNNVSWSMIGYNTVIGKTIKLSEGPKVMKNVTVMSQTLIQQKGRRLASTIGRNEKFQWRGPASWQNKNNEALILISLGRVGEHLIKELKMPSCKIFVTRFQMHYTLPRKHVGRFWPLKKPGGIYEEAQPVSSPRTWR